ncbi:hypothetical protein GCM10009839_58200 [Catenulispora yoronensis]|uniref:Uncharacterized protein n=1 Tax=Catenulispora yoronensis TaxID=450799 RepID=A0ABN2UYS2_9ACTN
MARGSGGWRIEVGDRQAMTLVLWLRDAAGMTPDLDPPIPPLEPPVAVVPELVSLVDAQATAQWTGLWLGLWEGRLEEWFTLEMLAPPRFELLNRSHKLRKLFAAGFPDAVAWANENRPAAGGATGRPAAVPGSVVKQLEGELGRRARDFELGITVLPVAGRVFWMLPDGGLVVSTSLLRDGRAFKALLYDVLASVV